MTVQPVVQTQPVPSRLGYRMPAEWEPHQATWLAWPTDLKTWPEELKEVEASYVEMVEALHLGEEVHLLVRDQTLREYVSGLLTNRGIKKNVFYHEVKTVSNWIRDYGPMFLVRGGSEMAYCGWRFNGWGGKCPAACADGEVPKQLAPLLRTLQFEPEMILEGGSVEVNGAGMLMTTEQCLLNRNRNPNLNRSEIERFLNDFFGVDRILWLGRGLAGDDTDGHVDTLARFVNVKTVVACTEENQNDENYEVLRNNWDRLRHWKGLLNLVPIPMPGMVQNRTGRVPANYANFYIANTCVLVPQYEHPNDARAVEILRELFPKKKTVGISCIPLIYGCGGLHCATQPQPAHSASRK